MRALRLALGIALLVAPVPHRAGVEPAPTVEVRVEPREATIGDEVRLELRVTLPESAELQRENLGPEIGPFSVLSGAWRDPEAGESGTVWIWEGSVAAYRTGDLEIPSLRLEWSGVGQDRSTLQTEAVAVRIVSVLDDAAEDPKIADLKPPAAITPDYGAVYAAAGLLGLLLLVSAGLWWLQRRFAGRLAAVPVVDDPFRRTPPHVWVYAQLRKLLDRRLPEQGQVDVFFEELSRILRRYLGGRYRVDLLERTTAEMPERLRQTGMDPSSLQRVLELLELCDRVKFARLRPDPGACKGSVDTVYRIVDATKPAEANSLEELRPQEAR